MSEDLTLAILHEQRVWRRWSLTDADGHPSLGTARLVVEAGTRTPDAASIVVGPGRPARIAILHGADPRIAQAVRRGALAAGAEVVQCGVAGGRIAFGEQADELRRLAPDAAIVQGDERGGEALLDLFESLRAGCAAQAALPLVIAAGTHAARLAAAAAPLPVEVIPDLRRPEGLAACVTALRRLRRGDDAALVLRDDALEALARLSAAAAGLATLVVDVTGSGTSLVRVTPDGALHAVHAQPLGLGVAADRVVARAGLDRVRRWLPQAVDGPTLLERVFNRARWPDAVAAEPLALLLEMALAREAIAHAVADAAAHGAPAGTFRDAPRIVLTGRLAELPRPAQSLLVALDGLEPRAVAEVVRDRAEGLVALGALAARGGAAGAGAAAGAEMLAAHTEALALVAPLATRRSATLKVRSGAGSVERRIEPGSLIAFAAAGRIEVASVSPDLRGAGSAGRLGVVVDARGRPLALPPRDADRVPTVARWFAALDAFPDGAP